MSDRFHDSVVATEMGGLRRRIQELEAQCAAMREALNQLWREGRGHSPEVILKASAALATDAGKAMLERLRKADQSTAFMYEVRAQAFEECAQVAEAEPGIPDEPMPAILEAMRDRPIEVCRACVSVTKDNIAAAIRAKAKSGPEGT